MIKTWAYQEASVVVGHSVSAAHRPVNIGAGPAAVDVRTEIGRRKEKLFVARTCERKMTIEASRFRRTTTTLKKLMFQSSIEGAC